MTRDELLALAEESWLVWSNEHRAYWRPNSNGYTVHVEAAGRYSFAEAEAICRHANYRSNSDVRTPAPSELMVASPEMIAAALRARAAC